MADARQPPAAADAADLALGRRLHQMRTHRGISRRQVALAMAVSPQQIEKYELGLTRVSIGRLLRFASAIDVPLAALLMDLRPGAQADQRQPDDPAFADASAAFATVSRIARPEIRTAMLRVLALVAEGEAHG